MSLRSLVYSIPVNNAAKVVLLPASATRRGWLIQYFDTTNLLDVYTGGGLIPSVSFTDNALFEQPGGFMGLVEAQLQAGGPFNVLVTEFL
jgi:hypothetical protein